MATICENNTVCGEYVLLDQEHYYRISHSQRMPEFFMSLVGPGDHWMFVSSSGALTAGRRNPDNALFPYAPDDQLSAMRHVTGPVTLIRDTQRINRDQVWAPFAGDLFDADTIDRNLYKSPLGNKVVFEETHEELQLSFRYRWAFSQRFGIVRRCQLENTGSEPIDLELLDGFRNLLPYGVGNEFFVRFSNLANAYKKSELVPRSQLGLFYLSSIPTDRAEPSEGLKSTVVWQTGLMPTSIMLSADQVTVFQSGCNVRCQPDVRGRPGAYLVTQNLSLEPGATIQWYLVAELEQDHVDIVGLDKWLADSPDPAAEIEQDIDRSEQELRRILSSADGYQCGANHHRTSRHLSNTVFNVMRGGIPRKNYQIQTEEFAQHVGRFNRPVFEAHRSFLECLPSDLSADGLRQRVDGRREVDLTRLQLEYLPLTFSRRHGDPTRPWNRFSIELHRKDGRARSHYEGNWRDIFQNWEAIGVSYPNFFTAMICRFVNATTADGYNPYRLTSDGMEWEEPEPDDPWSNIGYWCDHQIIYLLKLLEWSRRTQPGALHELLNSPVFVHADVPYRIKSFEDIKRDARNTIEFDQKHSRVIATRVADIGADGKLLRDAGDRLHHVTLMEKILTLTLAKLSNFVPDGGIWLNTQRPEWNDANNALVGNGLSMVTTCYFYRWFRFLQTWLQDDSRDEYQVSSEVSQFFERVVAVLNQHKDVLNTQWDERSRASLVEELSTAGSDYRTALYDSGPSGQQSIVSRRSLLDFFATANDYLAQCIRNNRRSDELFHAYNLLDWTEEGVQVEPLYEMLEGQVAVLSSGLLDADETVRLLDALRASELYRADQESYLLYPNRRLPSFLEKNRLSDEQVHSNRLLRQLLAEGDQRIVRRDVRGDVHFNGGFRNSADLKRALDGLGSRYASLVRQHGGELVDLFETLFGHRRFTGRSGTFFAYEGLGSIYWHMVSKLGLAVSECFSRAVDDGASGPNIDALRNHLQAIRHGIGAEKSPAQYGAFPSDPYSHSPENAGVKQPGMTGQVKEDILARFAQIGVDIEDGCVQFRLDQFDRDELLETSAEWAIFNLAGEPQSVTVPANGFGFTLCQVPIIYLPGEDDQIEVVEVSGAARTLSGSRLDRATSTELFSRTGTISKITCRFRNLIAN